MAKNMQPVLKRCKTLGLSPAVLGYSKSTKRNPKQSRRKQSEYGMQLAEKQKVKFIYGVLEKPFHKYYEKAEKKQGITGEILLQELERRLDNVVFRMGFANTRREARQLVNHAHFTVNGQRVNIPSYQVKMGDVIAVCEKSRSTTKFKTLLEENGKKAMPKWIDKDKDTFEGKIIAMPTRDDIDYEVAEHLIVELYSK
ncbi:30S ribosomal protein S4 [Intestinibacillus massiliensis]|uniref:30S ribosomal protein S4 n=1 Tax=Intestinibacillus massiliensis TaxID=1871029 RepID=UPI000B363C68|nr:30S ribosomal protein S4 [Intestinibacillus massiliensis]MCB6365814.1 30S ribosomal protein S4 [Intestinibacillus massiliensis]